MKNINKSSEMKKDTGESLGFQEFITDKASSLKKYQNLVIGDKKLLHLIKFEFLTLLLAYIPGLLGYFLRQKLYRFLFKKLEKKVIIGTGVSLYQSSKISIEQGCVIDDLVRLSVRGGDTAGIYLKKNIFIGRGTILNVRNGLITINNNSNIGSYCRIASDGGKIEIGENVLIAAYCYIGGGQHRTERIDIPIALQGFESKGGVTIGDDVWIGSHSIVADGVKIGKSCIIGANSFVNEDIPDYCIAFGSPARVHKKRN